MSMSGFDTTGKDQCFVFLFSSWQMDTDAKLWFGTFATFFIAVLCELTRGIPAAYASRRGMSVRLDMALSGLYSLQVLIAADARGTPFAAPAIRADAHARATHHAANRQTQPVPPICACACARARNG